MFHIIFFFILILRSVRGNVLVLNETEYNRMPPLYHLDPYDHCIYEPGGIYCSVKFTLISEGPSEMYSLIQNYSAHVYSHYNHSRLDYGICLTKKCLKFYEQNKTEDQRLILERCLNGSFWENYRLKTQVSDSVFCESYQENVTFEAMDIVVLTILLLILMLNVVGSLRQICMKINDQEKGFLACFSIRNNWRRLVAPVGEGSDPRLNSLKGMHGIRTICMLLVILCHSYIPFVLSGENTHYIEGVYDKFYIVIVANGTLIIQVFFMLSGLLLSYNLQLHLEKRPATWTLIPKAIFHRWIRLSCVYAILLAVWTTLMRHATSGPLRETLIMNQLRQCQRYWWTHLLYVNNYVDDSVCLLESWYLAADMQLYILGVFVLVFFKGRIRRMVLALLFIIGIITPAVHTYVQDLDPYFMITPETTRDLFLYYPTFHHVYKRGHTNICGFVVGLALGLIVLHCQNTNCTLPKILRHRLVYSMTIPIAVALTYLGTIFFGYGKAPILLRTVYSALIKPVFCFFTAWTGLGVILKFEDSIRGALEWSGWGVPGRVSFCVYLIHITLIRYIAAEHKNLLYSSYTIIMASAVSIVVLSYTTAVLMFLLFEAPFNQLLKLTEAPVKKDTKVEKPLRDEKEVGGDTEYNRMPPLYAMDDFSSCLLDSKGLYCLVDVDLYGNNSLMKMIQGYSAYTMKHFNHTQIHRGVCVTHTCKDFLQNHSLGNATDLEVILEGCLNESLWKTFELEGRVAKVSNCNKTDQSMKIDISDIIVAVVYLVIILLNVVGSFYDIHYCKKEDKSGNPYLLAFSVRRNWRKMVAPSGGPDPRLDRLKLFHGLRTMTMVCVFFSHTVLIMSFSYVDNPLYIERAYEDPLKQILFNGSLVTHTFFVMSSFLLAFNFQIHAEKHNISWWQLPKGILLRWLRLTPTYGLVLATICTWMRHLGSGPLWDSVVVSEADACRSYWWAHIFFINNYIYDDAFCAPQTWYLAADTQLFCVGLLICVAARSPKARKYTLLTLFIISLIIPALHTYLQDLDAVVIQAPEAYRSLYANDATFRLLYIRGHTNISTYTLGLAGGFLAYYWQSENKDFAKYKNYRWLFWLVFPAGVAVILSGGWFYIDGAPAGTILRVTYAAIYKPIFQFIVLCFIVGCVFKLESLYRGIVEWRAFTWTGRVSYGGFLLHTMFQRGLVGSQLAPTHMSDYYVITILSATIFLSYLGAAALWVCVEAPAGNLTKAVMSPRNTSNDTTKV